MAGPYSFTRKANEQILYAESINELQVAAEELGDQKIEADALANFETTTQLNTRDTANRTRANHTGSQAQSTITDLGTDLAGKAASVHTHGVTDLTATGTRDATTYLRGDDTWSAPSGGGGGVSTELTPRVVESVSAFIVNTASSTTANRAHWVRFKVAENLTVNRLSIHVGTVNGNVDVGLYTWDGTTMTRIVSTGSTANAGGLITFTIASTVLTAGVDYALALASSSGTATYARTVNHSAALVTVSERSMQKDTSFPLPATATGFAGASWHPWVLAYAV